RRASSGSPSIRQNGGFTLPGTVCRREQRDAIVRHFTWSQRETCQELPGRAIYLGASLGLNTSDREKPMPLPIAPQAILIDLAGVLHIDDTALPGAVDALASLRASGLPIRFLTNTTRSPRSRIVANLRRMGFAIEPEEIQTAVLATRTLVQQRNLHPHYLVHPDIADEIGHSHAEPDAVV